ncbi:MAG TPA: hypothetical protein VFE23_18075 [Usitatibacter sp.]|jgi:hypothetical protein|nr:hypothetical protein [Usitatibacter sp.]
MSDMKRAAQALVERRSERFESHHPLEESRRRLAAELERARVVPGAGFVPHWKEEGTRAVLEAEFLPPRGADLALKAASIAMLLLVVGSAYVLMTKREGSVHFLLPLVTLLAILGLPLVTLAFNSQREAHESRIRRAIRVALLDADAGFPPRQRWADEE